MDYVVIGLLLLAYVLLVYKSIIAPSLRQNLRFDLSRLHDKLIWLKVIRGDELEDRHFEYLEDMLRVTASVLDRLNTATLITFERERQRNSDLRSRIEDRVRLLDDCKLQRALEIRNQCGAIAAKAIAINNGAWFVSYAFISYARAKAKVVGLISLRAEELRAIMPHRLAGTTFY